VQRGADLLLVSGGGGWFGRGPAAAAAVDSEGGSGSRDPSKGQVRGGRGRCLEEGERLERRRSCCERDARKSDGKSCERERRRCCCEEEGAEGLRVVATWAWAA